MRRYPSTTSPTLSATTTRAARGSAIPARSTSAPRPFITFLPGEDVGIFVLTNGRPVGVAEAIGEAFLDVAENGKETVD